MPSPKTICLPDTFVFPQVLLEIEQWIWWRLEERGDPPKPTKVPYNPLRAGKADSTDPGTWGPFEAAWSVCVKQFGIEWNPASSTQGGIGIVLPVVLEGRYLLFTDLDKCIENGEVQEWAREHLQALDSFSEFSPSGRGIHSFCLVDECGRGRRKGQVEMYTQARFATVTGRPVPGMPLTVEYRQEQVETIIAEHFGPDVDEYRQPGLYHSGAVTWSDEELFNHIRASSIGSRVMALYEGRWEGLDYPSQSEADAALCSYLLWWTANDEARVDRIFRQSGLMREKWDRPLGESTYGRQTMQRCLAPGGGREEYETADVGRKLREKLHSTRNGHTGGEADEGDGPTGAEKVNAWTDEMLARAWAEHSQKSWLFAEGGQWWKYAGGQWRYRGEEFIRAELHHFLLLLRAQGHTVSITANRLPSILRLAEAHLGPHEITEFNSRQNWIPLQNGVYDVETGALLSHAPENMLTTLLPFSYDPAATCPRWERFLREVLITPEGEPCEEWIGGVQEWFGYCMISDTRAQVSMWWIGEGGNGKGVACRVLEQLVGPEQQTAVPIEQLHDPYYRALLHGRLVGFVNEPDSRVMKKNGEIFKALVGGDQRISARHPGERAFNFLPSLRITVTCNNLPRTSDVTFGYFRRIVLMDWRYNVPNPDTHLSDKLREELPGIFNWALVGLKRFRERGYCFAELTESKRMLEGYRLDEDTLARFIQERCEMDPDWQKRGDTDYRVTPAAFYRAYSTWCQDNGYAIFSGDKVGKMLNRKGFQVRVIRDGAKLIRVRLGVRVQGVTEQLGGVLWVQN